ncbi:MAG: mechanosensitive ion channel, partial [Solobacterium sp.]|nr:mechanosensitive ion channel [Solobacterium sp.]
EKSRKEDNTMFDLNTIGTLLTTACTKIVLALLVYIIGKAVINRIAGIADKSVLTAKMDATGRSFAKNMIRTILYVVLVISVISVLGVPMASVITVLATAGVTVGMALQGSLSNLAGGIMLVLFRPFKVGDYVSAGGGEGTVKDINLFYTVLNTVDNKTITIPNGTLMSANVTNFSSADTRRVDLGFSCAKGEDIDLVQKCMLDVMNADDRVLKDPAPFARLSGGTDKSMDFTVRAWVNSGDYWDVYFALTENITKALGAAGVQAPAARIITEEKK